MPFTFKLSQRLARLKDVRILLLCTLATACELPVVSPPGNDSSTPVRLAILPQSITIQSSQTANVLAFGISATGDTTAVAVDWTATGGTLTAATDSGKPARSQYKAGTQTGPYKIFARGRSGLRDSAAVTVVSLPVAVVTVTPNAATVRVGLTAQLGARTLDSLGDTLVGQAISWSSSAPSIARVDPTGLVTGLVAGSATITAISNSRSGTAAIAVTNLPVASIAVSPASASTPVGGTTQLSATPKDSAGNALSSRVITWSSNNTSVAQVSTSGLVTGVAAGSATVTATSEGKSASSAVTVIQVSVASVAVSPTTASIAVGATRQLSAAPKDSAGNTLTGRVVTWSSSNSSVATVSTSGLVTAVVAGSATITATSETKTGTAAITVTIVPVATVAVSPPSATIPVGGTVQLTATLKDASGNPLTGRIVVWVSSAPTIATVSQTGLVTDVADGGTTTITATSEGKSASAAITIATGGTPPPIPGLTAAVCRETVAPTVPAAIRAFYVNAASGNDAADGRTPATAWQTLDKANATAQPGDLFLLSGTFAGQWINPAQSGTAANKIVFRSLGSAVLDGGLYDGALNLTGRSHIVVDGLEVRNAAYPVVIQGGASNNWLRNIYLHSSTNQGILISGSTDNRIEDSRIDGIGSEANNAGEAIFLQDGASRNVIARNIITNAGHGLIMLSYQSAAEAMNSDNLIEGNELANPWANALGLNKSNRTTVQCNRIHDDADGTRVNYPRAGIEVEGSDNIIRFNEIYHNGRVGITIQGRTYAGYVQNAVNNQIYNNTLWGNSVGANAYAEPAGSIGFGSLEFVQQDVGTVQGNVVQNNIFWNDNGLLVGGTRYAIAADLYHANNQWPVGSTNGNIVRNNIFPTGAALLLVIRNGTANSSYTLAQAHAALTGWASNLQADPLFLNQAAADVRLQSTSPAIDAGVIVVPGIPFLGNAPDLGAREGR